MAWAHFVTKFVELPGMAWPNQFTSTQELGAGFFQACRGE